MSRLYVCDGCGSNVGDGDRFHVDVAVTFPHGRPPSAQFGGRGVPGRDHVDRELDLCASCASTLPGLAELVNAYRGRVDEERERELRIRRLERELGIGVDGAAAASLPAPPAPAGDAATTSGD